MGTTLDTTRELRRPDELARLVEAVEAGQLVEERSWIQWNSLLDLNSEAGAFTTARHILSFANRMPEVAQNACGGLAYCVVGVEPGCRPGTPTIDAADLRRALSVYVGADGPAWSPHYVAHAGVRVLVILVEPPRWGDSIQPLRKSHDQFVDGTVFVRDLEQSRPANSTELLALQKRLSRVPGEPEETVELDVSLAISDPRKLLVVDPTDETVDRWLVRRRQALVEWQTREVSNRADPDSPPANDDEIEDHLRVCRGVLFDAARRRVFESGQSRVTISVRNRSSMLLEAVELTLHLGEGWSAIDPRADELEELAALPPAPSVHLPYPIATGPYVPYFNANFDCGMRKIRLRLGQLPPDSTQAASDFSLVLHRAPELPERFEIPWSATSTSAAKIRDGVLIAPVETRLSVWVEPDYGIPRRGRAVASETS